MKYLKIFEKFNTFYYKLTQDEFDEMIQSPDIYTFTQRDMSVISDFAKRKIYIYQINSVDIIKFDDSGEWALSDDWDLDKWISSSEIRIHEENNITTYETNQDISKGPHYCGVIDTDKEDTAFGNVYGEEYLKVENFTIRLKKYMVKDPNNRFQVGHMLNIDIMKCSDEWFLVVYDKNIMYKCDQLDGLIEFISNINTLEAFRDEYHSLYDIEKNREEYWNGYLKKLKADQGELQKEMEEDPHYFTMISQDEVDELYDNLISFKDDEIERIKELFSDKYLVYKKTWKKYDSDNAEIFIEAIRPNCIIRIWKLEDEWYIVSTSDANDRGRVNDKCDQFDGLKRLLNKILVK